MLMLNVSGPIEVASAVFSIIMILYIHIPTESKDIIKDNFRDIYKGLNDTTIIYQSNMDILERLEKMIKDLDRYKQYYRSILHFFVILYFSIAVLLGMFINANKLPFTTFSIGITASTLMTILSFILIFWDTIKLQNMEKIIDEVIIKEKDNLIELIKRYYKPSFQFKIWRENK